MVHNITIDDSTGSSQIVYTPKTCTTGGSGWTYITQLGSNVNYTTCTSDEKPSAKIAFTGIAVYYQSPFFEGESIQLVLDGSRTQKVDLSTPPGVRYNASISRVVWGQSNLENKEHTIELFPGEGGKTLNVDGFIITQVDAVTSSPPSPSIKPSSPPNKGSATSLSSHGRDNSIALGLGITFGAISFLIFLAILIFLSRRRRQLIASTGGKLPPPLPTPPNTFQNPSTGFTQTRQTIPDPHDSDTESESGQSHLDDIVKTPMKSLPNVAHTAYGTRIRPDYEMDDSTRAWSSPVPSTSGLLRAQSSSLSHNEAAMSPSSVSRSGTFTGKLTPLRRPTDT